MKTEVAQHPRRRRRSPTTQATRFRRSASLRLLFARTASSRLLTCSQRDVAQHYRVAWSTAVRAWRSACALLRGAAQLSQRASAKRDGIIVAPFNHRVGAITGPTDDVDTTVEASGRNSVMAEARRF